MPNRPDRAVPPIRRLPALLVLAACTLLLAAGCGSEEEQSAAKAASVRAIGTPSPDLAARVVGGDELVGFHLVADDENEVLTDPERFSVDHAHPAEAATALRRDGFVAGTVKRFQPRQRGGLADSIAVQMRDANGAAAEAKRQFGAAFAPGPEEPRCAIRSERFEVPRVPGAVAVEIRHKVDGDVFDNTTIVFTQGAFVYQVFASGAGIHDERDELIDATQVLHGRWPWNASVSPRYP